MDAQRLAGLAITFNKLLKQLISVLTCKQSQTFIIIGKY